MREPPEQVIGRVLVPGETLLWSGAPPEGIQIRPMDALGTPLNVFVLGFAGFWEYVAVSSHNVFMMVWGIPFLLVGLYQLVGRFAVNAWLRAQTTYAVTDRRVIIALALRGVKVVESLDLTKLDHMTVAERPDGWGTITFPPQRSRAGAFSRRGQAAPAGMLSSFEQIEHAAVVFDIIQRAKQGVGAAAAGTAR